ncbi:hypothetical protein [Metabacillus litoralis]|uniref:hypothetical protein n=1 Tax=Metabacillus litoralis TaxID=152268 RepID=UPI0013CEF2E1|nr:hypothetical protein [Metabacillus litoralis]
MKKEPDSKVPNTEAFQDTSTRELLESSNEVKAGYYLFKSNTKEYNMFWPENATKQYYDNNGQNYERFIFEESDEEKNYSNEITTTFENRGETDLLLNASLKVLSNYIGYDGEYREIKNNDKIIYYAKTEDLVQTDNNKVTFNLFFSYIKDRSSGKGLEYIYSVRCLDAKHKDCKINLENEEKRALMLMKNVEFID